MPPGATILIDGESTGIAPVSVRLEPGAHTIEAQLTDYEPARQRLTLTPDGNHQAQLVLVGRTPPTVEAVAEAPSDVEGDEEPPSEPSRGRGAGPWFVMGLGLAVALTGSVLEIVAFSEAEPPEQFGSMTELTAWQERVADLSLSGYVLLGVGSTALVAGLIWALVRRNRHREGREGSRLRVNGAFLLAGARSLVGRLSF